VEKTFIIMIFFITQVVATSLDPDILNKNTDSKILKKGFYISLGADASYITMTDRLKNELKAGEVDDKHALGGEIGLGYRYNDFYTSAYIQKVKLKKANITNYILGVDYFVSEKVFLGVLSGQSLLRWTSSPVIGTISEDKDQKKGFVGVQFGMDYPIENKFYFYSKYQMMFLDHKTNINNEKNIIQHNIQNNFSLGVKLGF